eukprot:UN01319
MVPKTNGADWLLCIISIKLAIYLSYWINRLYHKFIRLRIWILLLFRLVLRYFIQYIFCQIYPVEIYHLRWILLSVSILILRVLFSLFYSIVLFYGNF